MVSNYDRKVRIICRTIGEKSYTSTREIYPILLSNKRFNAKENHYSIVRKTLYSI